MYYYKQVDRATGKTIAIQSSDMELQDTHPTIRLDALTELEYHELSESFTGIDDDESTDL